MQRVQVLKTNVTFVYLFFYTYIYYYDFEE